VGNGLFELSRQSHVWIADTAGNRATAERVWTSSVDYTRTTGVTTFKVDINDSLEGCVIDILDRVDDHHGLRAEWSSDEARRLPGE
jgi:hypothetical protein